MDYEDRKIYSIMIKILPYLERKVFPESLSSVFWALINIFFLPSFVQKAETVINDEHLENN